MTVSDLIEQLKDCPQDMTVYFWSNGQRVEVIEARDVGDCVDLYEEEA
jgi:hypothetical protein